MRLIDADALMEVFANLIPWCIDTQEELAFTNGLSSAYEATKNAPTIDAVPVVRCKDCKGSKVFQNDSSGVMARYCKAFTFERMVADNDFCSYGERRRQ